MKNILILVFMVLVCACQNLQNKSQTVSKQNPQTEMIDSVVEDDFEQMVEELDSFGKTQNVRKMQIMHECKHVTPEIMKEIIKAYKKEKREK